MSTERRQQGSSPETMAASWLHRRLAAVIDAAHRRSRRRIAALTAAISFTSGGGAFTYFSVAGAVSAAGAPEAAGLATIVSLLTAAALYPVLRVQNRSLLQAASTISHDNIDLLSVLGKLTELRDGEAAGHNLRVTAYTFFFAEALGLSPDEIVRVAKGALLHDVGKLAVPDRILQKPGPLTSAERAEMDKHVRYGLDIVAQSQVLQEAAPVVAAHHERYDGRGYPFGLKGKAIPHGARLFALVDVFDALTSARPYKPAFSTEEALATMARGRGAHFDPLLFDRFEQLAPSFVQLVPGDEASLTRLLMNRLSPYFDQVVHLEPALDQAVCLRERKERPDHACA